MTNVNFLVKYLNRSQILKISKAIYTQWVEKNECMIYFSNWIIYRPIILDEDQVLRNIRNRENS